MLSLKIVLVSFLCVLFLCACKKEENIPNPSTPISNSSNIASLYGHLVGEFYVERQRNGGYADAGSNNSGNWSETADAFITGSIEKDSLKILGCYFALHSINQTRFEYSDGVGNYGVTRIEVNFAHNYDSIYITYNTPCGTYGSCSTISYQGKRERRVGRPASGQPYNLWVEKRATTNNQDTQYRKDIVVNYTPSIYNTGIAPDLNSLSFDLEGEQYSFRGFACHAEEEITINYGSYNITKEKVYWKNDSFYLEQEIINYPQGTIFPVDTTYHLYKGRKI